LWLKAASCREKWIALELTFLGITFADNQSLRQAPRVISLLCTNWYCVEPFLHSVLLENLTSYWLLRKSCAYQFWVDRGSTSMVGHRILWTLSPASLHISHKLLSIFLLRSMVFTATSLPGLCVRECRKMLSLRSVVFSFKLSIRFHNPK